MAEPLYVIRWERPPEQTRGRPEGTTRGSRRFSEVVAELRDTPGTWGVIYEAPGRLGSSIVSLIRVGAYRCFQPAGSFECASRMRGGVMTVYARYVGAGTIGDA